MTKLNTQIQKIAEKAKGFVDLNQHVGGGNGCMIYTYEGLEKFTEEIVKECVSLMEWQKLSPKQEGAYNSALDLAQRNIREHFGIQ